MDADDFRDEEGDGLAEHAGFRFDAADAPADHAESIDHGGVGIRADEGVGVVDSVFFKHAFGKVFEIDLMDDADARGHDLEGIEGLFAPFEELVALAVAVEFEVEVAREGVARTRKVDLDAMVDDEVDRHEGFDHSGVAAHGMDCRAHGCEVDEEGDASEVLEDDAGDDERNFIVSRVGGVPVGEIADIAFRDLFPVAVPDEGFEHNADGSGEPVQLRGDAGFGEGRERVELAGFAGGGAEFAERILHGRREIGWKDFIHGGGLRRNRISLDRAGVAGNYERRPWRMAVARVARSRMPDQSRAAMRSRGASHEPPTAPVRGLRSHVPQLLSETPPRGM